MIVKDLRICSGQPTLQGSRLTVYEIVMGVFDDGMFEYAKDHEISIPTIKSTLEYCNNLFCQNDQTGLYCNNCILHSLSSKNKIDLNEIEKVDEEKEIVIFKDGSIYLGSKKELDDDRLVKAGWVYANSMIKKYFTKNEI